MSDISEIFDKRFMTAMSDLDVEHYGEVLLYTPKEYLDLTTPVTNLNEALDQGRNGDKTFAKLKLKGATELLDDKGRPLQFEKAKQSKGTHRMKVKFTDGRRYGFVMLFGRANGGNLDAWYHLKKDSNFYVYGRFNNEFNGMISIDDPVIVRDMDVGKTIPRYIGVERKLNPQRIADKIQQGLLYFMDETVDHVLNQYQLSEEDLLTATKIPFDSISDFLRMLHRPANKQEIFKVEESVRRLNALLAYQRSQEHKKIQDNPDSNFDIDVKGLLPDMAKKLPFNMTNCQRRAVWDILQDLNSNKPMRRLLNGDVGTGKTVAYMLPAVAAQKSGKNVVIMSPNSLLSGQIANEIRGIFPEVPVVEIQGGMKEYPKVEDGSIVVGTTAILFWLESINFEFKVDFYILDEQQKLGREQKELPIQPHTNFLEATATAIPRTMALIRYSDMEVSRIVECPVKKVFHNFIIGTEEKQQAFKKIKETLANGEQVAVLYPRRERGCSIFNYKVTPLYDDFSIAAVMSKLYEMADDAIEAEYNPEDSILSFETTKTIHKRIKKLFNAGKKASYELISEDLPSNHEEEARRSVEEAAKRWEELFPGRVGVLHGQTKPKEKKAIIQQMVNKEIDLLITTTVIEIGLTFPSLKTLMVMGADNLGASTLHQIRGRLVRPGGEGYFYMTVDKPIESLSEKSMDRLVNLRDNVNGFEIAEIDMMQRGFGDISMLGNKQSGFAKSLFPGSKTRPEDMDIILQEKASAERSLQAG